MSNGRRRLAAWFVEQFPRRGRCRGGGLALASLDHSSETVLDDRAITPSLLRHRC
jgi:hypothetical protein